MIVGLNFSDPHYFEVKEADLSLQNCGEDAKAFASEAYLPFQVLWLFSEV